jgi:hypothetical protein
MDSTAKCAAKSRECTLQRSEKNKSSLPLETWTRGDHMRNEEDPGAGTKHDTDVSPS